MSGYQTVKFGSILKGDKFECYGDIHLNYNYPKICECVKKSDDLAKEVNGISFYMDESDDVFIVE